MSMSIVTVTVAVHKHRHCPVIHCCKGPHRIIPRIPVSLSFSMLLKETTKNPRV